MANFVVDTFTDTTGTNLQAHTGETGATWGVNPDYPSNVKVSSLGNLFCPTGIGVYYASGTPATTDYEVEADIIVKSVAGSGGVMGRMNSTSPVAFYWARYLTNKWELYASTTNNATLIGQYSQTLTVGVTYNLRLRMVGNSIKVFIDDVERISVTSNTLTDKGLAGLAMASGGATESTGLQIVNFSATDIVTLSVFPTQAPRNVDLYTLTITGNGSSWDDDTVFTVDGEGVAKISQEVISSTSAQVVISTSDDLGEVTVSDGEVEGTFEVTAATKQIVFDGNSLTAGVGASLSFDYPSQMLTILDAEWTGQNFGVSSQTTIDMLEDAAETIDPLYNSQYDENILLAWEITNDLYFGGTKEDAYSRFVKYCKQRKAAGWKVFVITVLPRTGGSPPSDFEESRDYCNTKLRNNWRKFADGIIDFAADARYSDATDTVYFPDHTHLSNTGYGTLAAYAASVLFQALTEEEETTTPEPTTEDTSNCFDCGSSCKQLRLVNGAYLPAITVCVRY